MKIESLDTVLVQQALISGRITNVLNNEGLSVSPSISLAWRKDANNDYKNVTIKPTIKGGGYFAFYGTPTRFFPSLEAGESLQCRLTVQVDNYQPQHTEFTLSQAEVTPDSYTEEFSGFTIELQRFDAPVIIQNISMAPIPISLAGRVIEDNDINSPLVGASVTITVPAGAGNAVTDNSGYYRLENLPVVAKITVEVSHDSNTKSQEITLDYQNRINQSIFSLSA